MLRAICLQICEDIDEEKCLSIDVQTCETVTNDVRRQIIKIFILIILAIIKIMTSCSIQWHCLHLKYQVCTNVTETLCSPISKTIEEYTFEDKLVPFLF